MTLTKKEKKKKFYKQIDSFDKMYKQNFIYLDYALEMFLDVHKNIVVSDDIRHYIETSQHMTAYLKNMLLYNDSSNICFNKISELS